MLTAWGRILRGYRPLLSIEVTRECPLRCPGCYAYGENHLGGDVTLRELSDYRGEELVEQVLDLVRRHKPMQVSLVGGEPLIRHRELSRILPVLSDWKVDSLVVTSLVIPFPREWNRMKRVRVAVSIDGLRPDHDERRKPATYDRILENLEGRRADISWVVTNQQTRPGYMDEYLDYWSSRPEVDRIWLNLYTPQRGEESDEMLTPQSRRMLFEELPALREKYPKLILPPGFVEAMTNPPSNPSQCTFTRISTAYSADLRKVVEPCFYGGDPDCSQCGCAVSNALHWLHNRPLKAGLKAGHLIEWSLGMGRLAGRLRGFQNGANGSAPGQADSPSSA